MNYLNKKHFYVLLIIVFFIFAHKASANILISEIAWMGTSNSSSDEWIELYNDGDESVNLSNWTIENIDGDISIALSGYLSSKSYYLVERTDDSTVPSITADLVASFGHGISNSGETLILKNGNNIIQEVENYSGWVAGDSSTKETMQWDGTKWITALATPKDGSISFSSVGEDDNTVQVSSVVANKTATTEEQKIYKISTKIISPKIAVSNIPFILNHETYGIHKEKIILGKFVWNFGDGTVREMLGSEPFYYSYYYPGDYVITLSFYDSPLKENPEVVDRFEIKIIPSGISISSVGDGSDPFVEIYNSSNYEMSLKGWVIKGVNNSFVIPDGTIILPNKKLKLSPRVTNFSLSDLNNISIVDSDGKVFAQYPIQKTNNYKFKTVPASSGNSVKAVSVSSDSSNDIIDLNQLEANVSSSGAPDKFNNSFYAWAGLIIVIFVGMVSLSLFRRIRESNDISEEDEISAKDIKIIE